MSWASGGGGLDLDRPPAEQAAASSTDPANATAATRILSCLRSYAAGSGYDPRWLFLLRIAFWLGLLAAVLWLWPTARLALFLVFQSGGRDQGIATIGLLVCGGALLLSVAGSFLARSHPLAAGIALVVAALVGALALIALTLPLGSVADLAAAGFALTTAYQER